MSGKRYTEEFKIAAVKQVTERGHAAHEVADRLGISIHSMYSWIKRYSVPDEERVAADAQADEVRRLKAELKRVTDERDVLKRPPRTLPSCPGKVRLDSRVDRAVPGPDALQDDGRASERLLRMAYRA
jgi:transposase